MVKAVCSAISQLTLIFTGARVVHFPTIRVGLSENLGVEGDHFAKGHSNPRLVQQGINMHGIHPVSSFTCMSNLVLKDPCRYQAAPGIESSIILDNCATQLQVVSLL